MNESEPRKPWIALGMSLVLPSSANSTTGN